MPKIRKKVEHFVAKIVLNMTTFNVCAMIKVILFNDDERGL